MRLLRLAAAAALLLCGCTAALPPAHPAPGRVAVVSVDGLGAELAWGWLGAGALDDADGLAGMAAHGLAARRLRMSNPTMTSVNHVSLVTGVPPAAHGIVANWFHPPGTRVTEAVSGFAAPIEAETLWQAARRAGRRTAVLMWPGADGRGEERSGDLGMVWPAVPLSPSAVVRLEPATAAAAADGDAPALTWTVDAGALPPLEVTARDTVSDGEPRYDLARVEAAGTVHRVRPGGWFPVSVRMHGPEDDASHLYGAWCKLLELDLHRGAATVYRGPVYRLLAYPDTFAARLEGSLGFWPGPPDERRLEAGWLGRDGGIDLDTFLEQAERLETYLDAAAALTLESEGWELLLAYRPTVDEYQHAALLAHPDQWAWSPGAEVAARAGLERLGRTVDRSVARLWRALDPGRDVLAVVSDHGHVPIHDLVSVNRVLAELGLLEMADGPHGARPGPGSALVAFGTGGGVHLYLNLAGREPGGVVAPDEADAVLRRAARALADLEVEGRPAVEAMVRREEAGPLGLDHPSSGDLIVFFHPGFAATAMVEEQAIVPSPHYGQHGHLAHHDALCGVLFARGAGIERTRLRELEVTRVAPLVAGWLGMPFPAH